MVKVGVVRIFECLLNMELSLLGFCLACINCIIVRFIFVIILQPFEMDVIRLLIRVSMNNVSLRMMMLFIPLRVIVVRVREEMFMLDSFLFMSVLNIILGARLMVALMTVLMAFMRVRTLGWTI